MKRQEIAELVNPLFEMYGRMTVRQIFYVLVSRGVIPKTANAAHSLGVHLTRCREDDLIDADMIVDRSRPLIDVVRPGWSGLGAYFDTVRQCYLRDPLEGQDNRTEIWIEKDALAGIVQEELEDLRPPIVVVRGFSPYTLVKDSRRRLGPGDRILYFGDHDPSGLSIYEDVKAKAPGVERVAITIDQAESLDLPWQRCNPKDTRTPAFIAKYGDRVYELDALPPDTFRRLLRESFVVDEVLVDTVAGIVSREREELTELLVDFPSAQ